MTAVALRLQHRTGPIASAHPWLASASRADRRVLEHAIAPVLDVGCGPGRHCEVLAARGELVLGIDITPAAVEVARMRRVPVLNRSVFGRVPGAGRWATVLLLDGNIGIGGRPASLLERCRELLRADGTILVELMADDDRASLERARLELGAYVGPWFDWCSVAVAEIDSIARAARLAVHNVWHDDGRNFAVLSPVRKR